MKKIIALSAAVACAVTATGCGASIASNYREVEDLELIRTVGVDTSGDGDVTITAGTISGASSSPKFYQSTGPTVATAINDIQRLPLGKEALFSHTAHFVFSQEAAREGLGDYLDYIERSPDMRLDTYLFIVREGKAADLMISTSGKNSGVSEELSFMADNVASLGGGYAFTCRDVASALSENGCALIQTVSAAEHEVLFEEQSEKALAPDGLAVIKDGALVDFLDRNQSFGAALIMNKVKSRNMNATVEGSEFSVIVNKAKADIVPEFLTSGELRVAVKLELEANVISISNGALLRRSDIREQVQASLAEQVRAAARGALDASQSMDADFLRVWKAVQLKEPEKYEKLADRWGELYRDMEFTVEAKVSLSRTYDIEGPVSTDGEEVKTIWGTRIR